MYGIFNKFYSKKISLNVYVIDYNGSDIWIFFDIKDC